MTVLPLPPLPHEKIEHSSTMLILSKFRKHECDCIGESSPEPMTEVKEGNIVEAVKSFSEKLTSNVRTK